MFIQSIKFLRTRTSNLERGYYISKSNNSEKRLIVDLNYNPILKDDNGRDVWDYKPDTENWFNINFNNN